MKNSIRLVCVGMVAVCASLAAMPAMAATKTEEQFIEELNSPKDGTVMSAMQGIEKRFPTSEKGIAAIKKFLTDSRAKVRGKAVRVLGAIHADVSDDDVKNITAMLKSADVTEVEDALKGLRGLKAPQAVPAIVECLKSENENNLRDAIRTLAVLGNKDTITALEPFMQSKSKAVVKDADLAITALRAK